MKQIRAGEEAGLDSHGRNPLEGLAERKCALAVDQPVAGHIGTARMTSLKPACAAYN